MRVAYLPAIELEGLGVEDEPDARGAAEGGAVVDQDHDLVGRLQHVEDLGVGLEVDLVLQQELQRRVADRVGFLGLHLAVVDRNLAAIGDHLERRRVGVLET